MTSADISHLVREQITLITAEDRALALMDYLVEPELHIRTWNYGREEFQCWVVARADMGQWILIYAEEGFSDSWGIVCETDSDLGMDSQWFTTLDDAFVAAFWTGPLPPGYEVNSPSSVPLVRCELFIFAL